MRKDGLLKDDIINAKKKKKNGGLEMGFKKMGFKKKWLRTQRSEKMFREMNESKLGSLGR